VQPECDGCLGDRRCWVCLGAGVIDVAKGVVEPCQRCFGAGICPWCQEISIVDVGRSPALQVEPTRWPRLRRDTA
jgi:hypothetical protein